MAAVVERPQRRLSKQVSQLREWEFAVIRGRPCRITAVNKLGGDGWHVVGRDVFLGERIDAVMTTEELVFEPLLVRKEYILLKIDEEGYTIVDPYTSSVLQVAKPPGTIAEIVEDLFGRDSGEVRVTVGRTPYEEGVVDYRLA